MFGKKDQATHVFAVKSQKELEKIQGIITRIKNLNYKTPKIQFIHSVSELEELVDRMEKMNKKYNN